MKNLGLFSVLLLPCLVVGADVRRDTGELEARELGNLISSVVSAILPGGGDSGSGSESGNPPSSSTTTSDLSSSSPTTSDDNGGKTSTPATPTSPTTPPPTSSQTPPTTSSSKTSSPTSSSSTTTNDNPVTSVPGPRVTTVTGEAPRKTFTKIVTDSAGQLSTGTFVSVGSSAVPVASAGLSTGGGGGGGGGNAHVTSAQKRIIIGVVVGVGGFLTLAGIAGMAWRIWGRRGKSPLNRSDSMRSTHQSASESKPTIHSVDHFQKPANVNQSSNF